MNQIRKDDPAGRLYRGTLMHLSNAQLRSYLDGELQDEHLASCAECQSRLTLIRAGRDRVAESLNALSPTKEITPRNALTRFTNYQLRFLAGWFEILSWPYSLFFIRYSLFCRRSRPLRPERLRLRAAEVTTPAMFLP